MASSLLITVLWSALVGIAGLRFSPRTIRPLPSLRSPAATSTRPAPVLLVGLGRRIHRVANRAFVVLGRPCPPCQSDRARARLAIVTLVGTAMLLVAPAVAGATTLLGTALWRARRRRRTAQRQARVRHELPDVVELLAIAMGSGANLVQAIDITTADMDGVVCDALRAALTATAVGHRMVDALRSIPDQLGEEARPLVTALVLAERHGTPLVQALRHLADDLRDQRRRHAEEVARRVPIRLLGPLVLLLLPAFALLSVAPLLAGGLRSLRL